MRASASLVVVSPSSHVLFVLRPKKGSFPSSHVFPGGALDATDPSLAYCALRETYEETGLLIGKKGTQPVVHQKLAGSYDEACQKEFGSIMTKNSEATDFGLSKLSMWVTPPQFPKRFSTQFFIYQAPAKFEFGHVSKTPEVERVDWLTPLEALTLFKEGTIAMMPPQFYLMTALHERGIQKSVADLENRTFEPVVIKKFEKKGKVQMDWGQGESGIVQMEKPGNVSSIEYIRSNL